MSQIDDAKNTLGEVILTGIEGTSLSDDTSAFLSQAKIGGVILFSKNYESPKQVAALNQQIQECNSQNPLWIAVDQEGGRVQRFKDGFSLFPTGKTIGALKSQKSVFELSQIMARELSAVGVNINFTPVADILTNPENAVIGDRAFGTDAETVSKFVTSIVRGHITNGVQPCVKHFPGHGDTFLDSHDALPEVDTPLETLIEREFKPFIRAFKSRCSMVMTAHILNKSIDPEFPATFSKKFIQEYLRKEIRFSKIVFSDDLEMGAVTDTYSAKEAPILALNAGCDILIYRTETAARTAYESMSQALESGKLPASRVLEAAQRSQALKESFLKSLPPQNPDLINQVGSAEHQKQIEDLLQS